ncbi:MAG: ORF6N domain-containing protein [Candidatus Cloacimonetes bacterium]|nr:ORF6N domain-containing protein [Candidatus Cloacimonadota bacterium]
MLDRDLALLYGVETRTLNQLVKRNIERFPASFMFQLNEQEFEIWKSKIVQSNEENLISQFVISSS